MRIIVVSTPKTGNTWMSRLLSTIYDLPGAVLPPTFRPAAADQLGSRWVVLQHYYPEPRLLAWGREHQVQFVTMLRHPGDILVSLWHMIRNRSYDPNRDLGLSAMLMQDGEQMGRYAVKYVEEDFFYGLYISLDWEKSGESVVVRYEELWRDPVTTLAHLTEQIKPVPRSQIETAVDLCDIRMLRRLHDDPDGKMFRKGGPGSWRHELPGRVVDVFRHRDPYPDIFRELGYTLDPRDPLIDAPKKPRKSTNPFLQERAFDNGADVPLSVIKLYLSLDPELKDQWFDRATATGPGSFYAWLNAAANEDPREGRGPVITNLAYYIYRERSDLQKAFPDPFGEDRHRFARWFVNHAQDEYDLHPASIAPVRKALRLSEALPETKQARPSLLRSWWRDLVSLVSNSSGRT